MPSCGVCLMSVTFVYCVETVTDTATVTTECEQKTNQDFEWYTICSDLVRPLTQISRSRHYLR